VDDPDVAQPPLGASVEVVGDHRRGVAWRKRVQVEQAVDRERHRRTVVVRLVHAALTAAAMNEAHGGSNRMIPRLAPLLFIALLSATPARAVEVEGVQVPDELTVGTTVLRHNGSGVRKKFVIQVYLGSLYLKAPSRDAEAIVAADEPKAVRLHFLRDVSKEQMLEAFRDGFRANSPDVAASLQPRLDELARALPPKMKEGSLLFVTWVPGTGTVVNAGGGGEAVVAGKDFADALFRNWLGHKPADDGLKRRMLGR
jgi:hypothetical protein